MDARRASIRTPDQRIRVFLSSTLRELEPERRAARAAIESLQLAPVMFEIGARPHPPRELYRSYLEQSDIFVGVYWQSYGWTAPDEDVSGLEDEYRLSGGLPHLIYIKEPADTRDARLTALLDRVRNDDRSSYRSFRSADELQQLLRDDLAMLLAERFAESADGERARLSHTIPAPFSALVGREREKRELLTLLATPGVRLVTIVGPGGIGKSRLAIDIAGDVADTGREVAFVLLETVTSPDFVVAAIARAVGVRDAGGGEALDVTLAGALADRDILLVVDNMEHLLDATSDLVRLLIAAPRLQLLVTSRSPLRVRAERTFDLGPLAVPADGEDEADAAGRAAVELFVQRARAVRPGFDLNDDNAAAVAGIVRALDGVPLAIELAAARIRAMSPQELLDRLGSALSLLVHGARDLPERQRALRSTIEWSVRLLDESDAAAFAALGVFTGPFTFEAAEAVLADRGDASALASIEALLDASLLWQRERHGIRLFGMLALVDAYAREQQKQHGAEAVAQRWTGHYRAFAREARDRMRGADQLPWLRRLDAETENVAGVMRHLLDARDLDAAAEYAWSLYMYLWIAGMLGVVRRWMAQLLATAEREQLTLAARTEAIARYYTGAIRFWEEPDADVVPALTRSIDLFVGDGDDASAALAGISLALAHLSRQPAPDVPAARDALETSLDRYRRVGDAWGEAMALVSLGRLDLAMGDLPAAAARFDESLRRAQEARELLGTAIAHHHCGWPHLFAGELDAAEAAFAEGLDLSFGLDHDEGIVYGLEGLAAVSAARGRAREAGLLLGAAGTLRRRTGIINEVSYPLYGPSIAALRETGMGAELDAGLAEGAGLPPREVVARVRG